MAAIEDARAALASNGEMSGVLDASWAVRRLAQTDAALRALIAEHERLTAPLPDYFAPKPIAGTIEASLTTPPTDDEREALVLAMLGRSTMPTDWRRWPQITYAMQLADGALAAGFRRPGPITDVWERRTENRIHYRYGVNSGTYSAWPHGVTASHDEQQRRLESETSGPVDVTLRESRTVVYGPWEPVEAARDA